MPNAVVALDFDPYLHLGDRSLRWETLALAAVILLVLCLAALAAGRTVATQIRPGRPMARDGWEGPWHLRRDDLLFIALGVVPGAVVGGRLGYGLLHLDYYATNPGALLDPAQGSLSLSGALVVGTVTGAYVARLLDAPVGRWLGLATVPVLLGLALGKLATVLGGAGQGALWDGQWATLYVRDGPWGSLLPGSSAHPSQVYEAGMALVVLALVLAAGRLKTIRRVPARQFLLAVGLWTLGRAIVALTWRDPTVLGPFRAEQLVDLVVAAGCVVAMLLAGRNARAHADMATLAWPDPATRPRF